MHICHGQCTIAHPVRQPSLVILHVGICLQGLDTLQDWIQGANQDCDFLGQASRHRLEEQIVEEHECLERGWNTRPALNRTHEGEHRALFIEPGNNFLRPSAHLLLCLIDFYLFNLV